MSVLDAKMLCKSYTIGNRQLRVLDAVTLSVNDGEFLVVSGSSGSGKSTLLSLLSGLDRPTSGRVVVNGQDITDSPEDALARIRNETIGFVFQSFHLIPSLTVVENIMFPAELKGDGTAREKAHELTDRVGLTSRVNNYPHQLSGGEKQRTAICRALINRPKIIFADEPTGNLDSENGKAILDLLLEFHQSLKSTLVMVTHNAEIAGSADRVIVLSDGRIISDAAHAP